MMQETFGLRGVISSTQNLKPSSFCVFIKAICVNSLKSSAYMTHIKVLALQHSFLSNQCFLQHNARYVVFCPVLSQSDQWGLRYLLDGQMDIA